VRLFNLTYYLGYWFTVRLLQSVLEINTKSMEELRSVLYSDLPTIRISKSYSEPTMAADMFEADQSKLDMLYQRGRQSYREREPELKGFF
jgi:hypothetical protein